MAEWRHPYEDLLRMPLSAKERLRGERMCGRSRHRVQPDQRFAAVATTFGKAIRATTKPLA